MADTPQHSLLAEGLSQGQGPDIFELARATRGRAPAAEEGERQPTRTIVPGTGVAAIDIFTRKSRREEQTKINTSNALQRAQDLINASNIDPKRLTGQEMQGLQGLALSDPGAFDAQIQEIELRQRPPTQAQLDTHKAAVQNFEIGQQNFIQEEIETTTARMGLAKLQGGIPDLVDVLRTADNLNKQLEAQLSPYTTALSAYDNLIATANLDPTGASSVAASFQFIRSMDNTAVRASEIEMLSTSGGPVRSFMNDLNRFYGEGVFAPETFAELIETATAIARTQFEAAESINNAHMIKVGNYATEFLMPQLLNVVGATTFDPGRTFGEPADTTPPATPPPPVDDISTMEPPPGFTR